MNKIVTGKFYLLLLIIIILSIWPVIGLYNNTSFGNLFSSPIITLTTLGKIVGLVGLATFAIGLILSARFVWMDKLLSDLTHLLKVHRWLGVISFSLIVFHPIFLAARYLPTSSQIAWGVFWNWGDIAYIFGYVALLLFMFLVVMTFFWRMKYERLKMLHSLLAVPLMLGGLHALLIDSDVKRNSWLSGYFIVLVSLGVLAYLTRLFLVEWGLKSRRFIVESVSQPTASTIKIVLRPNGRVLSCRPGQFVFIRFNQLYKTEEHPFSVAGISPNGEVTIVAKILGDFTERMKDIKEKSLAYIDGPYGSFGQVKQIKTHQIWIAGGIGITPFLSLATDFVAKNNIDAKVDLIYSVAKPDDFVDLEKLRQLEVSCPQFKLTPHVSSEAGRLDVAKIKALTTDFDQCVFCLCGPQRMVANFVKQLKKAAIPKSRINIEAFELL